MLNKITSNRKAASYKTEGFNQPDEALVSHIPAIPAYTIQPAVTKVYSSIDLKQYL